MNIWIQLAAAGLGSVGFSIVFKTRPKYWWVSAVDAVLSWGIFLLCQPVLGNFFANLIASLFCSCYAHVAAIFVKAPTTCLLMPASVPMIPGGSLYYTMAYALDGNRSEFERYMFATGKTILAMAIAFALMSLAFRTHESLKHRNQGT